MDKLLELSSLPIRGLRKVRDLEYFEGPLLSEFKSHSGDTYLYSWCDLVDSYHRWMVFRVAPLALAMYVHERKSLHDLVTTCQDGFVYLVDLDTNGVLQRVFLAPLPELPQEYIPSEDSLFDRESMPSGSWSHDVLIGDKWALSDVSDFTRKYEALYSVLYVMGDRKPQVTWPADKIDIRRGRGFASEQLFHRIKSHVPKSERPKVKALHMSSPGILSIDANEEIAGLIPQVLARFMERRREVGQLYNLIYDTTHDKKDPPRVDLLRQRIAALVEQLGFVDLSRLTTATQDPLELADWVLAYYRKVRELVSYQNREKAEIL